MIEFKWSGKAKQTCRVNGVVIGFFIPPRSPIGSYYLHSRFSNQPYPKIKTNDQAREKIQDWFLTWLKGATE